MSIKERRERQKQATKEGILSAARQIARAEGWGAVTVRRVAEMVDYTPPIIYQYFAGKDAMLEELQRQGFLLLADGMRDAVAETEDAEERLLRMSDAYWHFARQQPELDQIMHDMSSTRVPLDTTISGATLVGDIVQGHLEHWALARKVTLSDPAGAVEDAVKAAGKPYAQVVFSEADHGFFCDARASYNPEVAAQAWALMLAFLASHLKA